MRGSDAIVKLLIAHGVRDVFGVPGDTSMNLHDSFAKNADKINHIVCRDERNAVYMADGYARVKGKPGVVEVPSGGGALYAVPGVSEANLSSIPLVCLSSDITMSSAETGALTDVDQVALYKPITKWNSKIRLSVQIPNLMRKAFRLAVGGRPGAVHLAIPENVHGQDFDFSSQDLVGSDITSSYPAFLNEPGISDINQVIEMIKKADRPVIIAGGGVHLSNAYLELESFVEKVSIPVATTINGKGSIAEFSDKSIGVIGANGGAEETNQIIKESDFVLVLGSKLNNVTTMGRDLFVHNPKVVQVDIMEEMLDSNIRVDLAIMSDIRSFLQKLNTAFLVANEANRYKEWLTRIGELREKKYHRIMKEVGRESELVNVAKLFAILENLADEDTIFVADAGTPTPFLASYLRLKKSGRKTILPRAHGSLGYALPAAIGAQVGRPTAKVFSLFGDGSFGMAVGDLETANRLGLPIIFVNFQNNSYGWIKTIQKLYYEERYLAVDFAPIDAVKIAQGFGLQALKIDTNDKLEEGLKWAMEQTGPVLIDLHIESPTDVIPPVLKWERDSIIPVSERKKLTY